MSVSSRPQVKLAVLFGISLCIVLWARLPFDAVLLGIGAAGIIRLIAKVNPGTFFNVSHKNRDPFIQGTTISFGGIDFQHNIFEEKPLGSFARIRLWIGKPGFR